MKVHLESPPSARLERLVEDYRQWLMTERSLAMTTVRYYVAGARLFLSEFEDCDLQSLSLADVTGFVVRQCPCRSVGNAKNLATSVRSLWGCPGPTDRLIMPPPGGGVVGSAVRIRRV
jgi:hypothetical protein